MNRRSEGSGGWGRGYEEEGRHGMSRSEAGRIGGYHAHGERAPEEEEYYGRGRSTRSRYEEEEGGRGGYSSRRSYYGGGEEDRRGWNAEYEPRDEFGRFMPERGTRGYGGRSDIREEREERAERAERMPRDEWGQFIPMEEGGRGYSTRGRMHGGYEEEERGRSRSRGGHEEEGRHGMSRSEAGRIGGYPSHGEPAPGERSYRGSSSRSRGGSGSRNR